jgi:hypothetical protein
MVCVPLLLIAAMVGAAAAEPDPDSAALVAKLGSVEPAERTAAAGALDALGRKALPALEQARAAPDHELRARAAALWDSIQRGLMPRPSMVRLDFQNRPVGSVLDDLMKQTGLALESDRAAGAFPINHAPEPAPVTFWEAIERLGLKNVMPREPGEGKYPTLLLRTQPVWRFTSTNGPFRVALMGLHLHRDTQWIRGPWVRIDRFGQRIAVPREEPRGKGEVDRFYGGLEVTVEPRMRFTQEAPVRLTEARDDLGQSLIPEPDGRETNNSEGAHYALRFGHGATQGRTEFLLRIPERIGRTARLRGVVPVMLHLRRPEPALVIPLDNAAGQTFRCDDAEFTIHSVNHSPNSTNVSMTVRLNLDKAELPDRSDAHLVMTRHELMGSHQLQLTDEKGTVLAYQTGSGSGNYATPVEHQWTIHTFRNGRATQLRYFGMLRVRSEAAFEFRDVPLP